ncbi:hypothetical protein VD0003_g3313, partial [Verticillium dahliae]
VLGEELVGELVLLDEVGVDAGAGVYSYLVKEYKLSNELLTEDIYALQAAVQRVTVYVQTLEEKMDALERKRK